MTNLALISTDAECPSWKCKPESGNIYGNGGKA